MSEAEVVYETEEVETAETETAIDGENKAGEAEVSETETEQDEVVVTIGDEESQEEKEAQEAPQWVKELRKSHREVTRKNRELEEKLKSLTETESKKVTVGEKPTLAGCDFDSDVYETKLAEWYDKKKQADAQEAAAEAERQNQQKAWQDKLSAYEEKKVNLKVKDFDEAEEAVKELLNITQQGIIVQGAKDPALLVLAIGKNPEKAKELAAITDPIQFAFAVATLETQLKVAKRKAPAPEKTISGTAKSGGAVDSQLERLRAEAEKTGDLSKVIAYKRQKKSA